MKKPSRIILCVSLALLVCLLCSCSLLSFSKLELEEYGDGYAVTDNGKEVGIADLVIPDEYKGKPVVAIGANAFARYPGVELLRGDADVLKLTSVTLPDSVTEIGSGAFQNQQTLTTINIPAGVTKIGDSAFASCEELTSITIPDGVTEIKEYTFFECKSLTSIVIPDSVKVIANNAFKGCTALESVTLSSSLTEIGDEAFRECGALSEITIPDSVTKIGAHAFRDCVKMKMSALPASLTHIGDQAFTNCDALEALTLPTAVTDMGEYVFSGTTDKLVVSVSYDKERPEGWSEKWCSGMAGKALNTSEAYYNNVVVPNQAKAENVQKAIESLESQIKAAEDNIDGIVKSLENARKNASINPTDAQLQRVYNIEKQLRDANTAKNDLYRQLRERKDELAAIGATNQLNISVSSEEK